MLKKDEYLKTVKRPYPPLLFSLACLGYPNKKYYKGILKEPFSITNLAHVDDVWWYGKAEMFKGGQLALEAWKDKKIFDHVVREFKKRENALVNSWKKDFKAFAKAYGEYMPALALIFAIEKPLENELRNALSKKLKSEEVEELMGKLNIPMENNFYKKEEYDLVVSEDLKEHVKNYEWLYARYGEKKKYTVKEAKERQDDVNKEEFLEKWKKDKKDLQETIDYAKKILGKEGHLVNMFQYLIYYRTHRTDIMNKAAYLAVPMFEKTAKSLGLTYDEFLLCSALEVLNEKIPDKKILAERKKDCTTLLDNGKLSCLTGEESKKIIDFFEEKVGDIKEFRGTIACKGNVEGKVKVIINKKDFDKVEKGNILVTSMTTPEMVPIMKLASAFVTDEGGVTCHAAIISREMNKPCIIGTKIATKALKDGDEVEVDADKGEVRKVD